MSTIIAGADIDVEPIVMRLSRRFDVAESIVRPYSNEATAMFADARIRSFVPILVERRIHDMLHRAGLGRRAYEDDDADTAEGSPYLWWRPPHRRLFGRCHR